MIKVFGYDFFLTSDGNALTLNRRIQEALESIKGKDDYIILGDGKRCNNEKELREALRPWIRE